MLGVYAKTPKTNWVKLKLRHRERYRGNCVVSLSHTGLVLLYLHCIYRALIDINANVEEPQRIVVETV